MSSKNESSASQRVAEVLKSGLERQLVAEVDAVAVAGHGSHVVSNKFEPGAALDDGQMDLSWDDEKFQEFVERLSESQSKSIL
jgi:hypothetical protein